VREDRRERLARRHVLVDERPAGHGSAHLRDVAGWHVAPGGEHGDLGALGPREVDEARGEHRVRPAVARQQHARVAHEHVAAEQALARESCLLVLGPRPALEQRAQQRRSHHRSHDRHQHDDRVGVR
jgi:hypothetical protein